MLDTYTACWFVFVLIDLQFTEGAAPMHLHVLIPTFATCISCVFCGCCIRELHNCNWNNLHVVLPGSEHAPLQAFVRTYCRKPRLHPISRNQLMSCCHVTLGLSSHVLPYMYMFRDASSFECTELASPIASNEILIVCLCS